MLDHVINLLAHSENHHHFTVEQINRCIIPPVNLNQCCGIVENGHLVAWCSWAFLSEEKADIFLDGIYKIQPDDWRSGDVLVIMDFVAPFGHMKKLYTLCRSLFPQNQTAKWRRHKKNRRVEVKFHA